MIFSSGKIQNMFMWCSGVQVSAARLPLALSLPCCVFQELPARSAARSRSRSRSIELRCEPAALLGSDLGIAPQTPLHGTHATCPQHFFFLKFHFEPSFHPNFRLISEKLWWNRGTKGLAGVEPSLTRFPWGWTSPGSSQSKAGAIPCGMVEGCEPRGWICGTEHHGLSQV